MWLYIARLGDEVKWNWIPFRTGLLRLDEQVAGSEKLKDAR